VIYHAGWWFGTLIWWLSIYWEILGIIIPTDKLIFFRGVAQPPTPISSTSRYSHCLGWWLWSKPGWGKIRSPGSYGPMVQHEPPQNRERRVSRIYHSAIQHSYWTWLIYKWFTHLKWWFSMANCWFSRG
jgi:hypothetical protein